MPKQLAKEASFQQTNSEPGKMSDPTQNEEVDMTGEVQNEKAGATAQAIPTVGTVPVLPQQPLQPLQSTPQDFSSLLLMMQQQIQGQNMTYQSQMENHQ